jgi:hypothetical protein
MVTNQLDAQAGYWAGCSAPHLVLGRAIVRSPAFPSASWEGSPTVNSPGTRSQAASTLPHFIYTGQ